MKIRPKNIQAFQQGGGVPRWYLDRYGNRTKLLGWDLNQRYNYANENLNLNDHRNAGDLNTVYRKNVAYTGNPGAISSDIQHFYDSDGNGMSAEDFVNFYNKNAAQIRGHWAQDQTYNASTAGDHNRLFRRMFASRSNQQMSPGSDYNIGYQEGLTKGGYDIQDIEGSSTWLRRMDQYENEFDPNNPDSNRLHEIILKDGTKAIVYKKANGDIGLLNSPQSTNASQNPNNPQNPNTTGKVPVQHKEGNYGFDWQKVGTALQNMYPELIAAGRLFGNLRNNNRVYKESLKAIRPDYQQTYYTHRQIVGDEAAKQAEYRRAAAGESQAARAFTSDSERQMAHQLEAKRIGDDLRTRGDMIDNQEIKRTSDESNQHQWANTQRATEVKNLNRRADNMANALRHQLKSSYISADWTSYDNALKELEYRARQNQAERRAKQEQIDLLDKEHELSNDEQLYTLKKSASDAYDKYAKENNTFNYNDYRKKMQAYRDYVYKKKREALLAKSGIKITYKKKDDLLYKTSRDAVEHFRKMTKMSSDSYNRKRLKLEKLTPHPKGNTKKYQQGGVAPFTVYTPISLGGETTRQAYSDSGVSSAKSSSKKGESTLDIIKELFGKLDGLPSDVNGIYANMQSFLAKQQAFGNDLDTDDLSTMYLDQLAQINNIKFSKAAYDQASKHAEEQDAINEVAVDSSGRVAVQNSDGAVKFVNYNNAKESGTILTNGDLLQLRAYSPNMRFNDSILNVVNNGIGMSKIAEFIKSNLPKIGSSENETVIEGYTKKQANDIARGAELLMNAPDGDYKYTQTKYTKEQNDQINAALGYISTILPKNMKAVLNVNADLQGIKASDMLKALLGAESSESAKTKLEFDAVTGKAAKDSNGNSKSDEEKMIPALAFFNGLGEKETFIIQDKTSDGLKINTISAPITEKGFNTGSITFDKLQASDFGGQLNMNQATMGDALISSTGRQNIIIDGRIYQAELPIDQNAKNNEGIIKPDLRFLKNIEAADVELRNLGIDKSDPNNVSKINEIYKKHNLPILYTISNNKLTITSNYARFAIVNGIGTEDAFGENPEFNDAIQEISGNKERESFESLMRQQNGNSKYKLNNGYGIGPISWGETKLYKGTIYIPMVNSNISALGGTGYKAKGEEYNQIEVAQQSADAAREMGFNPAGDASNL